MNKIKKEITIKQKETLETIELFINNNGFAPTIRELCKLRNVKSPDTIYEQVRSLKMKGYITYLDGKSRTIKILRGYNE